MKKCLVFFSFFLLIISSPGLADAGSLSGKVLFSGKAPPKEEVIITKDLEKCGIKGKLFVESMVVNNGGLANVVLQIANGQTISSSAVTIDQTNCRFAPHILTVPAGSKVTVINLDGILHNFHTLPNENEALNFAQRGKQKIRTLSPDNFEIAEIFPVRCDIHEWMNAYIAVMETPYSSVSGNDGTYKIANIPDGSYTLKIWHEKRGSKEIVVKIKGNTHLDVKL